MAVGEYYDFGHEVLVEIRSKQDPYMVFSNSRYHLGADFSVFKVLSLFCLGIVSISLLIVLYWWQVKLVAIEEQEIVGQGLLLPSGNHEATLNLGMRNFELGSVAS